MDNSWTYSQIDEYKGDDSACLAKHVKINTFSDRNW